MGSTEFGQDFRLLGLLYGHLSSPDVRQLLCSSKVAYCREFNFNYLFYSCAILHTKRLTKDLFAIDLHYIRRLEKYRI